MSHEYGGAPGPYKAPVPPLKPPRRPSKADSILVAVAVIVGAPIAILLGVGSVVGMFWAEPAQRAAHQEPTTPTPAVGTRKPVEKAPPVDYRIAGDGSYIVGREVKPGTYKSYGGSGSCYWKRVSDFKGRIDSIIESDLSYGSAVVTIVAGDKGFITQGCGQWRKVEL